MKLFYVMMLLFGLKLCFAKDSIYSDYRIDFPFYLSNDTNLIYGSFFILLLFVSLYVLSNVSSLKRGNINKYIKNNKINIVTTYNIKIDTNIFLENIFQHLEITDEIQSIKYIGMEKIKHTVLSTNEKNFHNYLFITLNRENKIIKFKLFKNGIIQCIVPRIFSIEKFLGRLFEILECGKHITNINGAEDSNKFIKFISAFGGVHIEKMIKMYNFSFKTEIKINLNVIYKILTDNYKFDILSIIKRKSMIKFIYSTKQISVSIYQNGIVYVAFIKEIGDIVKIYQFVTKLVDNS